MIIRFLGAAKTVTGSFHVIESEPGCFAVDCGLFQESKAIKERNYKEFPIDPSSIDFVILSHAHIDHIGLIPKLCKHGFKGPIYCSHATQELAGVLLPDSGHIQESEIERKNRKLKRAGKVLLEPIYTVEDAEKCLSQFRSLNMDETFEIVPGIQLRLRDAGHILGSCILELWITENDKTSKMVYSGDLGNSNQPIIKDPSIIENTDYLMVESTYGNRFHKGIFRRLETLEEVINYTMDKGGNLVIPAFAVERTQDLLYDLNRLYMAGKLDPTIDIYIDSPLAIAATQIFGEFLEYYDHTTRQMVASGNHPFKLPNLKYSKTQEESMELNKVKGNTIIISASGMCDAGRIKHHLKHNLWRPESTVLFVGYQANGTLGRRILDGEKLVTIHGESVVVKADIRSIESYSAHADRAGLVDWIKKFVVPPKGIFLVHGEEEAQQDLADYIQEEMRIPVFIPDWMDEFELKPSERVQSATPLTGDNMSKALLAEQMYLQLRLKVNDMFREKWVASEYDQIIDKITQVNTLFKHDTDNK
ncbi:MBL fold metallo-hydrolase RNA specificity domain-containing protein [Syntrophomonas erecta]